MSLTSYKSDLSELTGRLKDVKPEPLIHWSTQQCYEQILNTLCPSRAFLFPSLPRESRKMSRSSAEHGAVTHEEALGTVQKALLCVSIKGVGVAGS